MRQAVQNIIYLLFHPIEATEEIKYKKKYKKRHANIILLIFFLISVISEQLTGFIFNNTNPAMFNILIVFIRTAGIFLVFVICNWSVCVLFDGEGRFLEIYIFSAYALVPVMVFQVLYIVLSRFLLLEEQVFISMLMAAGIGWSLLTGILSLMAVHQYTLTKTVLSLLATVLGMGFILFLCMLMFGLFKEISSFIVTVFRELLLRI